MILSPRQIEIARMVAEQKEDDDIAAALGVSVHTVREHLRRIAKKIDATPFSRRQRIRDWWSVKMCRQ